MTVMLPTLSTKGWLDPKEHPLVVANQLLSHFLCSDYSQTQIYLNSVSSLSWVMNATPGTNSDIEKSLADTLQVYFSKYFDTVFVDVAELPEDKSGRAKIKLYLEFTSGLNKYTLAKAISIVDGKVAGIIENSNFGR
jgi:hypothetical protein